MPKSGLPGRHLDLECPQASHPRSFSGLGQCLHGATQGAVGGRPGKVVSSWAPFLGFLLLAHPLHPAWLKLDPACTCPSSLTHDGTSGCSVGNFSRGLASGKGEQRQEAEANAPCRVDSILRLHFLWAHRAGFGPRTIASSSLEPQRPRLGC